MSNTQYLLDHVHVRPVSTPVERLRWDDLIARGHYLHSSRMLGEQVRYVAEVDGTWVGLLGWCSATLSSAIRRHWIGWNLTQERQRLHLIVHNARFLILGTEPVPNLASRILGLCTARLKRDWKQHYGHDLVLAETFVDAQRFRGTCYRAAGWSQIGTTQGHRRLRTGYQHHGEAKLMLMKELVARGRVALCADHRGDDRGAFLTLSEIALDGEDGLLVFLHRHIRDPRSRRGRSFMGSTLLGIIVTGVLTGRRTLGQIQRWAAGLDADTLGKLGCQRGRDGRMKVPCTNCLRYVLKDIDPPVVEAAVGSWLRQRGLLGPVPALSFGERTAPERSSEGGLPPWHLRWAQERRRTHPDRMGAIAASTIAEPLSVESL